MRYYRITTREIRGRWGNTCTFWFEIDPVGDATRQIQIFPNGYILSYDVTHPDDAYDGLQQMVVDGDATWWQSYQITREAFVAEWERHVPVNRPAPVAAQIPYVPRDLLPRFPPTPSEYSIAEGEPPPF